MARSVPWAYAGLQLEIHPAKARVAHAVHARLHNLCHLLKELCTSVGPFPISIKAPERMLTERGPCYSKLLNRTGVLDFLKLETVSKNVLRIFEKNKYSFMKIWRFSATDPDRDLCTVATRMQLRKEPEQSLNIEEQLRKKPKRVETAAGRVATMFSV